MAILGPPTWAVGVWADTVWAEGVWYSLPSGAFGYYRPIIRPRRRR